MPVPTPNMSLRKPPPGTAIADLDLKQDLNRNWDKIDELLISTTPTTAAIGDTAAAGTTTTRGARGDHKHGMPAFGSPSSVGTTNSAGTAASLNRSDHLHTIGSGIVTDAMIAAAAFGRVRGFVVADTTTGAGDSFNLTSVSDEATGLSSFTWNTDFAGVTYLGMSGNRSDSALYSYTRHTGFAAGVTPVGTRDASNVLTDPTHFYCIAMGTQ